MTFVRAVKIFNNLDSEAFTDEEKALAINEVMNSPSAMCVKKEKFQDALKFLWNKTYEFKKEVKKDE